MLALNVVAPMGAHDGDAHFDTAALSLISINTMKDMVVWIAADGSIVFANASAQAHFGRGDPDLINKKIYEIDHDFTEELWRAHWREILERKAFRFETAHRLSQTETVPIEVSVNLIEHGGTQYNCAVFHDITERKRLQEKLLRANEKLEQLALTDPLTSLGNRREFERRFADEWAAHRRTQGQLSLMLIDVDYFKAFNDTYGHPEGDICLQRVATVLRQVVRRETDIVTRIGGEEFACVLPGTNSVGALILANAVREGVEALAIPHAGSQVASVLTVSVGVVTSNLCNECNLRLLVKAADRCLYEAKMAGRNRVSQRQFAGETGLLELTAAQSWVPGMMPVVPVVPATEAV